jgi:hypothetical protein
MENIPLEYSEALEKTTFQIQSNPSKHLAMKSTTAIYPIQK